MKEVVWTEIAETDLELLIKYLRENWSAKVLLYFKLQLEKEIYASAESYHSERQDLTYLMYNFV